MNRRRTRRGAEPQRATRTARCRGVCGGQVDLLQAVCAACSAALPPDLAAALAVTRFSGDIVARFAAEDAARAWLLDHPAAALQVMLARPLADALPPSCPTPSRGRVSPVPPTEGDPE